MSSSEIPTRQQLNNGAYTVGIITVLPNELAAAIAVLAEEHDPPSDLAQPGAHQNNYTWGRIANHNVAIVQMKEPGKVSSAATAMAMLTTIPSIRFFLIVGTGGGVPYPNKKPKDQVRLGDVVISAPSGAAAGVVQYDLGKEQSKDGNSYFQRTGSLGPPPRELRTVLNVFKARMVPSHLDHSIGQVVERLGTGITRFNDGPSPACPGPENDCLFPASYEHQLSKSRFSAAKSRLFQRSDNSSQQELKDCQFCNRNKAVERGNRDSSWTPEIHYGLIASGDKVIKNAEVRDSVVSQLRQKDVGECLCFEMEAAGLMNDFQCLVIRGISNYADTHKNDTWQAYAAVTAAAVAKMLLQLIEAPELA
ncbi:pfs domain-containing protein [Diplodia corticola]|uniref:Pfs domain-containing protein n=1 Tax=Diplodia corticola TaxID=236234 RepID=A0A1J9QNM1_9PEZI|nr:pfs domain-containing protein [Diplodia corticola]OJD29658.1 pfs domain-containing protein [Diplodia corticola]